MFSRSDCHQDSSYSHADANVWCLKQGSQISRTSIVINQATDASRKQQDFINTSLDLPQRVSAIHCHHQGVVVSSESTQAVCIVDVCGLWPVQSGQLSRDVIKCVQSRARSRGL
jgi:hypothetical protein